MPTTEAARAHLDGIPREVQGELRRPLSALRSKTNPSSTRRYRRLRTSHAHRHRFCYSMAPRIGWCLPQDSIDMAKKLRAAGVSAKAVIVEGEGPRLGGLG